MSRRSCFAACLPIAVLAGTGLLCACASRDGAAGTPVSAKVSGRSTIAAPTMIDDKPRDFAGVHNVVAYHEGYYSGGAPEGAAGFDTLAAMGVKTIISVDGAEPEVGEARARGIRYIHLPIGYNGFDEQRKLELVRATRDAMGEGPVYIHCHHGKHRSAGAAATVAASLGWMTPDAAKDRMKVSGTSAGYKGLYACAASADVLGANVIDAVPADFPEVAQPAGFVKAMIELDEINERLKAIEKAGWTTPKEHPDLVPVAEAGRMADLLRFLSEGDRAQSKVADFGARLKADGAHVQKLEDMLLAGETDGRKLSAQLAIVAASCKDCHAKYRD
ncbi:MAG: hypothetical protein AABZ53_08065 [Planctomycetota bacterium]